MKRIFTFISIVAAMVFAASCSQENFRDEASDGPITLRLQTAALETRAAAATEENEFTLTHADFFFFSDEEGTDLLNHTRLEVTEGELVSTGSNLYEYTFGELAEGDPLRAPSYVYVIANYPETITATTLEDILALDIKTDLSQAPEYFVMDSYDSATEGRLTYLKPSQAADSKTYTIGLTRAAAKLTLTINVADSFTDEAGNEWTPETSQMWVNYLYARKNAVVAAEPVAFDAKANYFNTAQETPTSAGTDEGVTVWTTTPVYTYPVSYETSDVTAPYYKIFCPWKCEKKGLNNFYYKIVLPDLGSFQRNKVYNLTVNLSVIGGTEDDWALVSDHIYVADWWAPEAIETSFEGAMYLDVPVKSYEIYGVDYIDIPVVSSNDIQVLNVTGTKTNLYNGNTVTVTPSITNVTKEGFRLTHELDDDITSSGFDCTPITYTMTVKHTEGGLSKTVNVTVVQYPSIYAESDLSNSSGTGNSQRGYAYVNSYTNSNNHGGRYRNSYAYNNQGTQTANQLGTMNSGSASNSNYNQYVVTVSVLPAGYKVKGLDEDIVIGDPRGGRLSYNYLGYAAGTNGDRIYTVQDNYNAVSSSTQNVIAPAIRIASSWGATNPILNYDRAEERCASYQENGYPAGRWRMPTVAEIDFLIRLSDYNHIPELFSPEYHTATGGGPGGQSQAYYDVYWAGGHYGYGGKPYTDQNHTSAAIDLTNATENNSRLVVGNERFVTYMRCVYDEWYWSSQKYGNNGTASNTAATQWIGYIF